jgi:large subunit ribosomal protein L4
MKVDIYNKDGKPSGNQIELPPAIFEAEPNEHAVWLAVKAYLAHQRQGTSKTKNRWEVRGGGRKPWRQKGRGTARSGSTRSPLWTGGGNIHGPKPRTYDLKVPKQVKLLARRSALSMKLKENQIRIVEDFTFDAIKTKSMVEVTKAFDAVDKKILVLTPERDLTLWKSGRNIPTVAVKIADKASTYDILNNKMLLIQKSAVEKIVNTFVSTEA